MTGHFTIVVIRLTRQKAACRERLLMAELSRPGSRSTVVADRLAPQPL